MYSIWYIPCLFIDGEFNDESTMGKGWFDGEHIYVQ